jgi:translation elongation factor P/translation initiation factor 5A
VVAASELRDGMIIRFNGTPCRVLVLRNCGGVILARLKNLLTGESLRQRFRAEAKLDEVLAEREMVEVYRGTESGRHVRGALHPTETTLKH